MASKVYRNANPIPDQNVKSGNPVKSLEWGQICNLSNFLNGGGGTLIPAHGWWQWRPEDTAGIDQSATKTFKYFIYPRTPNHARLWILRFASHAFGPVPSPYHYIGEYNINSAGAVSFMSGDIGKTYYYVEQVTSPSETPVEVDIAITNTSLSTNNILVEQISCYELPRAHLVKGESNVKSSQRATVEPGNYIRETSEESVFGPFEGIAEARETNRRNGVYHYQCPDGLTMSAAGWTDIHGLSSDAQHEALGRYLVSSTVDANLRINILAKVDTGTSQISILPIHTGASSHTVSFSNTVATWIHGTYGHLVPVRAEDLSAGDGRRNSAWETIQYVGRVVTSNTLTIYAISVGEKADDN